MAIGRPKKNTVDYFPHLCKHGKTMQIIKNKFANDGRALWWNLLEILGATEGHFYDCKEDVNWEFLASECLVSTEKAEEILNTLAKLKAIDPDLWGKRIIWSQNFVDGLAGVYKKRGIKIPQKPLLDNRNLVSGTESSVSGTEIRQSKSKSKVKYSKDNTTCPELQKDVTPGLNKNDEVFITIPLIDKTVFEVTNKYVAELQDLYRAIDVEQQLRNIKGWDLANPKNQKTKRGIKRHINGWLEGKQNKARVVSHEKGSETSNYEDIEKDKYDIPSYRQHLRDSKPELVSWYETKIIPLLEENLHKMSILTWFKPLIPIEVKDGVLRLHALDGYFVSWIDEHYAIQFEYVLTKAKEEVKDPDKKAKFPEKFEIITAIPEEFNVNTNPVHPRTAPGP